MNALPGLVAAAVHGARLATLPSGLRPSGRLVVAVKVETGVVCVTEGNRYDVSTWYQGTGGGWSRLDVTSTVDARKVPQIAGILSRRLG